MIRTIFRTVLLVLIIAGLWALLSQVNWSAIIPGTPDRESIEERLGSVLWESLKYRQRVMEEEEVRAPLDTLLAHLNSSNDIDTSTVRLHIVKSDMLNAVALPDGHVVIFSEMIRYAENEAELAGVLAHELAHVEQNHIMDKLVRELGMSVLITITTGDAGGEVVRQALQMLSSRAHSRKIEQEADEYAVRYLLEAGIDPEAFSYLMYRIGRDYDTIPDHFRWFATHPDPEERARFIAEQIPEDSREYETVLSESTWLKLQEAVK